jgi:hypothetical protein
MVVDEVDENWGEAAVRRGNSTEALADDRVAVGEGVDAVMTGNAALEFAGEVPEFVGAEEIWKNVAETKFGCGFGEIDVSKPVQFAIGR